MTKKCLVCGTVSAFDVLSCPNCGEASFELAAPELASVKPALKSTSVKPPKGDK